MGENPDDPALLKRFVEQGDRQAIGILFSRHADAAYRLALRVCRHSADAEDAVQAAFFEVLRHAAKYRGESAVKPWILGFVVNSCRHKAREEGRRAAREARAAAAESAPREDRDLQSSVRNAVQELPDPYRVPVWLHYCEGLTSGEVAETLSLSENTVRSQLSRGVDQLRTSLAATGLSISGAALTGALAAAAVETAPPTLAASLAGIASGAVPAAASALPAAKAGFLAKLAAGTVAVAAIVSTASFLWVGTPDPPPPMPPEFAWIDRRVEEWQPTRDEKRFDEIGWARDLRRARGLSRELGRPQVVISFAGRIQQGRSDGGAVTLRGGPLSDPRVIERLNALFVPVYTVGDDYDRDGTAPAEEKQEFNRIYHSAIQAKLSTGSEHLYFVEASSGAVFDSMHMCKVTSENLIEKLNQIAADRKLSRGAPASAPAPQCVPPAAGPEDLVLHVTARYLDKTGNPLKGLKDYCACPAEDWVVLTKSEWSGFLASEPSPEVDPAVARKLLVHFYPVTGNWDPAAKVSQVVEHSLRATVVASHARAVWVRLDGSVKVKHAFFPSRPDDSVADAAVVGFLEIDPATRRPRTFRMVTEGGHYGQRRDPFGVAVRSLPQ